MQAGHFYSALGRTLGTCISFGSLDPLRSNLCLVPWDCPSEMLMDFTGLYLPVPTGTKHPLRPAHSLLFVPRVPLNLVSCSCPVPLLLPSLKTACSHPVLSHPKCGFSLSAGTQRPGTRAEWADGLWEQRAVAPCGWAARRLREQRGAVARPECQFTHPHV